MSNLLADAKAAGKESPLLLSKAETAQKLGVCIRTIDNLLRNCELPSVRVGRRRLIPATALSNFVRRHHPTHPPVAAAQ